MNIIKFEVGKEYFNTREEETITVSKRTEKTIWFCDDYFSARIKLINGVETVCPTIGMIRRTYWANK